MGTALTEEQVETVGDETGLQKSMEYCLKYDCGLYLNLLDLIETSMIVEHFYFAVQDR